MLKDRFKPDSEDFIIVVMGATGSGKSNFINKLTGHTERRKAGNLKSDTENVTPYPISHQGFRVVVVDTPGFDDTYRPDSDILRTIANWLTQKYPDGTVLKIAGIIYIHRISDNRMSGSAYKNLQIFGRLCGNIPLGRTYLVTTMWDQVKDQGVARQRETQLKSEFWRPLIDEGAMVHQFHNTPHSARQIVDGFLRMDSDKVDDLLLQEELVEQKKRLNETEAGKIVYNLLQKLLTDQRKMVEDLASQARSENDPVSAQILQEEYRKVDAQLQKTFEEIKEMKIPLSRRILLWLSGRKSRAKAVELDHPQA